MQQDLNRVIEQVSKEKGIDKSIIIAALEEAMLSAARRTFGLEHQIEAKFNSDIGQRFERKNIIVNLGRTDAILPEKEQIPRERYRQGDRIREYIVDVALTSKGPQIVLSRTHPGLLIKL